MISDFLFQIFKENDHNLQYGSQVQEYGILQHTCEHCLMGIRGTVRRSTDGHIIHANVDNDIIITENPPYGSTQKPEDIYDLIQRFCMGRKRLELFGTVKLFLFLLLFLRDGKFIEIVRGGTTRKTFS